MYIFFHHFLCGFLTLNIFELTETSIKSSQKREELILEQQEVALIDSFWSGLWCIFRISRTTGRNGIGGNRQLTKVGGGMVKWSKS